MTNIRRVIGFILVVQIAINGESLADEAAWNVSPDTKRSTVTRHTWKELRDLNVIKQKLDTSCGAAALSTLMTHYFGDEIPEKEILDILKIRHKNLTKKELARKKRIGFSLSDLKYAAQKKGYQAAGFRLSFAQLRQLAAPVIAFVKPFGYHHFAVLRGIAGDRVFLADPSRGNIRLSTAHFLDEYGGIVFVIGKAGEENILNYPLALSRPDDYARPDPRRLTDGINGFRNYTTNLTLRARLR